MRLTKKQQASLEFEKLSKHGAELLELFHQECKDSSKSIGGVVAKTFLNNYAGSASVATKAWMAAKGASRSDCEYVGKIVMLTGFWGIWKVEDGL